MTSTTTYTGLPVNAFLGQSPDFPVPNPPPLPPMVSLHATKLGRVTMDSSVRLPTSWRTGIGKLLTNRRIAELQREGHYGSGLKLPALDEAKPCIACKSKVNTRQCNYQYLPQSGTWCTKCLTIHRAARDKVIEDRRNEQRLFVNEYI